MPRDTVGLPNLVQAAGVSDPSTATGAQEWDVADAEYVAFKVTGTTTAPGPIVQVSLTSSSGSTFSPMVQQSTGYSFMNVSTSGVFTIWPITFKLLRLGTTAASTAALTYSGNKAIVI